MNTKKKLILSDRFIKLVGNFNLIYSLLLLWLNLHQNKYLIDFTLVIGLGLTIWYNWESLKKLKGLSNRIDKLNFTIGILVLIFAFIFIISNSIMIYKGIIENNKVGFFTGLFRFPLSLTILTFTFITLKLHRKDSNSND